MKHRTEGWQWVCAFRSPEHTCELCSKAFPKRHLLNNHKRSHHGQRSPLPCPQEGCGRQYWDKRNLRAHVKRYHEKQRFACHLPSCGKTFASKVRTVVLRAACFHFCVSTFPSVCLSSYSLCCVCSDIM